MYLKDCPQYLSVYSRQALFKVPMTGMIPLPSTADCFQTDPSGISAGQMLGSFENSILV